MYWTLRLIVLLDKGTFENSFPADSSAIVLIITTAAGRTDSTKSICSLVER